MLSLTADIVHLHLPAESPAVLAQGQGGHWPGAGVLPSTGCPGLGQQLAVCAIVPTVGAATSTMDTGTGGWRLEMLDRRLPGGEVVCRHRPATQLGAPGCGAAVAELGEVDREEGVTRQGQVSIIHYD